MNNAVWMRWNLNWSIRIRATTDVVAALTDENGGPVIKDGCIEIQGHALGDLLDKCPYNSIPMNIEIEVERESLRDAVYAALGGKERR